MSSNESQSPENGCVTSKDLTAKANLKSAVISDNDPLKIKLKISKRDITNVDDVKSKTEDVKMNHSDAAEKSVVSNGEENKEEETKVVNSEDGKMKLRSKREEGEDGEEKKKEVENERPVRKRVKREEEKTSRRKSKRVEELSEGEKKTEKPAEVSLERLRVALHVFEPYKYFVPDLEGKSGKGANSFCQSFCWTCHKDGSTVKCDTCPRVFHPKCVSLTKDPSKDWICPECSLVLHAEKMSTRSEAMKSLSLDQLCTLLGFAIERMKNVPESEAFWKPVDPEEVPFYHKYITNPMDLNQLERNMKAKMYGSPQAFLGDAKWLLHNSIIFNSTQSPLTSTARFLVKICRQEMAEIENCPDCYLNAHTKNDWFIEVCRKPHILIWARLKGFPFWPAKAMSTNFKTQSVDARFFGAHDKAWVPVKECFLYSKNSPNLFMKKRTDLDEAFAEVGRYISKIREKFGSFSYASDRSPFVPEMYDKQLQSMIPTYPVKKKRKEMEENGVEKLIQNGKRTRRQNLAYAAKIMGDVNDFVSEEKVNDPVSPEDEIARSLEMYDTHKKVELHLDESSTDLDEEGSVRIPEHGYSRSVESTEVVRSSSEDGKSEKETGESLPTSVETVADNLDSTAPSEQVKGSSSSDHCEVSSTSTDLKEPTEVEDISQKNEEATTVESPKGKKEEEKSSKSFVNLSCDQQQKILTEAKLLANIDEMTASGKEKVLNDLGLDGSQVNITELAKENRKILETLNKKCQEKRGFEEVSIKNEDFEQYLLEENSEENVFDDEPLSNSPKPGSIKVRDFNTLTRSRCGSPTDKSGSEPMLKILDVQSLRNMDQTMKNPRSKRSSAEERPTKKQKLEPVIELIKLPSNEKPVEKCNRQVLLSNEVSLVVVEEENKKENKKENEMRKTTRTKARKSMPNRSKTHEEEKPTVKVISLDAENSAAQKGLLKSLCLEEKKQEEPGNKSAQTANSEKGSKNSERKAKEVTVEVVKDGKTGETQKNLAVMNPRLLVTTNGPAIVAPNAQGNLAIAQNNLGQLSLVHLSNLTNGIQPNFINLTNEAIGFNNGIGTLYATPGFNQDGNPAPVILTTAPVAASTAANGAKVSPKTGETAKASANRVGKSGAGISVKSPASLGLVTPQPDKLPPLVAIQGGTNTPKSDAGAVTAELNKHSKKIAEYVKTTIEEILKDLSSQGSLEAKCKLLSIEMEKLQWRHQQEIMELKHNSERSLMELRNSLESEKQKCLGELKAQLESQHQKIISETKRKQWCANCGKEALFYCCWNTSYCDYPCQQQHWPGHMSTCAQLGNNFTIGNTTTSQLQIKSPGTKLQNSSVPVMSRGGSSGTQKGGVLVTSRAVSSAQAQPRRSSDPSAPQVPVNITIRSQQYFM